MKLIVADKSAPAQAARAEPTIVRRFLAWAQGADAGGRADAASALARAYLYCDLGEELRREAVVGLTAMLDDHSALVRRALAEALAGAGNAPHHVIYALANDQPEIAAVVLARTPVLSDAELVDCAAIGDVDVQIALARRTDLSVGVAAALAEIGRREAVVALAANLDAPLTAGVMRRIVERFGEDGEAREALLSRPWIPATLRCDLVAIAAKALAPFVAAFGLGEERIERMMREAREQGAISVASAAETHELRDLIGHLRASGALTIALLMRALLTGNRAFFVAAAADLSGLAPERVAGFARDPLGSGFSALYRKTGLPVQFLAPFRAALAALHEHGCESGEQVSRPVAARVIAVCEAAKSESLGRLLSLLRRLDAEAAIEEARAFAQEVAAEEAAARSEEAREIPTPLVWIEPAGLIEYAPPILIAVEALEAIDGEAPPVELPRDSGEAMAEAA